MDGDMFLWLMPGRRSLEEAGQPLLEYSRSWGRGRGQGELSLDSDLEPGFRDVPRLISTAVAFQRLSRMTRDSNFRKGWEGGSVGQSSYT